MIVVVSSFSEAAATSALPRSVRDARAAWRLRAGAAPRESVRCGSGTVGTLEQLECQRKLGARDDEQTRLQQEHRTEALRASFDREAE